MTRVWCIRGGEKNRLVDQFVQDGVAAVGYYRIPNARTISGAEVVRRLREDGYAAPEAAAKRFSLFVSEVSSGDVVLMPDTPRGEVVIGFVDGAYVYCDDVDPERYRHRRPVRWVGRHRLDDLPDRWRAFNRQRPTLQELDAPELLPHARRVEAGEIGRPAKAHAKANRRARASPGPAPAAERECPDCHTLRPVTQFAGHDRCPDCR
jgi:predicted Mrr-cat superfamily restriction endonuclease